MRSWLRDHLGLAIAGALVVTALIKIWSVAHGDRDTMVALFASQGTLNVAFAALVAGLPSLGYLPLLTYAGVMEAVREGDRLHEPIVTFGLALGLAFATVPASVFWANIVIAAIAIASSVLIVLMRRRLTRRGLPARKLPFMLRASEFPRNTPILLGVALVAVLSWMWIIAQDSPWLPSERITEATGVSVVGYVLSSDSDWVTIMEAARRKVIILPTSVVKSREPCAVSAKRSMLSTILFPAPPAYPPC